MPRWWTFWAVVLGGLALAWLTSAPPNPLPASAPETEFSAERAMATVREIGARPHPIGSAEHGRVRDAILRRLGALGLQTWTATGAAVRKTKDGFIGADVENILAVLPGRDRGKADVLLMAHYDSVPGSPAAADDSAGVASILETVRAVKAQGQPARDLVVLITDGEETGLFGARAAFREGVGTRDLKRVGAVINLETRGSAGPAFMFETGRGNGGVIDRYARHVARPAANSLTGWVYDRMPNGSDFTVAKEAGLPGVNIAFIGRPFDYHSPTATPDNLDRRSLQHMGDQALAMTRAFLDEGPGPRTADRVYADAFGWTMIAYPAWAGWIVLVVAAGLIGVAMVRAGRAPWLDLLRGAGLLVLLLAFPALLLRLAWRLAPVGADFYQSAMGARFDLYFAGAVLLAVGAAMTAFGLAARGKGRWIAAGGALVLGLLCSARGGLDIEGAVLGVVAALLFAGVLGRPLDPRGQAHGLLLGALVLAVALQAFAPGIAFLVAWPLLGAATIAVVLAVLPEGLVRDLAATVVGAVVLGWMLRMAVPLFDGLGLTNPELLGLFTLLAGMIVAPFLLGWIAWGKGGPWTAAGCSVAGVALLAVVALVPPWSARTPRPSHVLYVADTTTGRARVVSLGGELDLWSRAVLAAQGAVKEGELPVLFADRAWWAEAGVTTAPAAASIQLEAAGAARTLRVTPPPGTRDLKLTLTVSSDARVSPGAVPGFARPAKAGRPFRIRWYSASAAPVAFALRPAAPHGTVRVQWAALRDGWPADARPLPSRPADVMPQSSSDASVVTGEQTLRW